MISNENGTIIITGSKDIALTRLITLKHALKLEVLGMTRHGRSVYSIVKNELGLKGSKQNVLDQLVSVIEELKRQRAEDIAA